MSDKKFDIEFEGTKVPDEEKLHEMIIKRLMEQGKTREEAEEEIEKWDKEHKKF